MKYVFLHSKIIKYVPTIQNIHKKRHQLPINNIHKLICLSKALNKKKSLKCLAYTTEFSYT